MRQISLLGLGDAAYRHSDGMHVLRPDRVYRTSVLSPMTGFVPGQDVMATSRDFVIGPYTGMQLSGPPTFGDKFRMWWQGVKDRLRAGKGELVAMMPHPAAAAQQAPAAASEPSIHAPGEAMPPTAQGHAWGHYKFGGNAAPAVVTADYVGPLMRGIPQRMVVQAYGQSPSLPTYAEEAASKTTMMMWRGLRWPWH